MDHLIRFRSWRRLPWLAAFVWLCTAQAGLAQQAPEGDPPGRVGVVTERRGSVVFAPEGDEEWTDLPPHRPLTTGDRLWTDRGARAEVHLGPATLHLDGESHLGVSALDDRAAQFILMQGVVNARVRELAGGENFEIDTPHLAFRATQPGDYRIDVAAGGADTRVLVHSGAATVFGEGGQAVHLGAGQQASFAGRLLERVASRPWQPDAFSEWAAARNRAEDQSVAARHVPRGVVGYPQLDAHGSWSHDPGLGAVWVPNLTVADWAPYRHGRWTWMDPWGWTWVDDAPWGFAPFHYGRWAMVGSRWAWVPGQLAQRPAYAPALVAFMGGEGISLATGSGPGVGWYPLAPGEPWYPGFRTSPRYLGSVNFNIDLRRYPRHFDNHRHRRHQHAVTVVREDDFRRGRRVHDGWRRVQPDRWRDVRIGVAPGRPDFRDRRGDRDERRFTPRLQAAPPAAERNFRRDQVVRPAQQPHWRGERDDDDRRRREARRDERRQGEQRQQFERQREQRFQHDRDRAVREQVQAAREQQRLQREAERAAREQQRDARQQRQREQHFGQPFPESPVRMQPPPRQQAAPIGHRPQRMERPERGPRADRGDRGERGGGRMERGGRGQRDDDGRGRGQERGRD